MRKLFLLATLLALPLMGAQRAFNFSDYPLDRLPPGFRSTIGGQGEPGDWRVILDDAPPAMEPLTAKASSLSKKVVLAQLSKLPVDERFPMLIFEGDTYGDFKLTTRFKIVSGGVGQMAGVVFRFQDEQNYYALLASALDNHFWFFKMVNGQRGTLIGPSIKFRPGEWHELSVECAGNRIHCFLDGKEAIPTLTDNSFSTGRIGFWTKSDSVSYFADTTLTYTPREILAQKLLRDALTEYSRLKDLAMFASRTPGSGLTAVASKDETGVGETGGEIEQEVMRSGKPHFYKTRDSAIVTLPLRDRNGEPIAAVRVTMRTFFADTRDNALLRAQPVVRRMQAGVQSLEELLQ